MYVIFLSSSVGNDNDDYCCMQRVNATWPGRRVSSVTRTVDSVRVSRTSLDDVVTVAMRTSITSQQAASVCTFAIHSPKPS